MPLRLHGMAASCSIPNGTRSISHSQFNSGGSKLQGWKRSLRQKKRPKSTRLSRICCGRLWSSSRNQLRSSKNRPCRGGRSVPLHDQYTGVCPMSVQMESKSFDDQCDGECRLERLLASPETFFAEVRRRVHIRLLPLLQELETLESSGRCSAYPTESQPE